MDSHWHIDADSLREVCDDEPALEIELASATPADRVFLLRILGRLDQAANEGVELLAAAADPFRPMLLLADVYRWMGKYPEAAALQDDGLALARGTPREAVTRQHIGKRLFDQARYDDARGQFAEALRLRLEAASDPALVASSRQALARAEQLAQVVPDFTRMAPAIDTERLHLRPWRLDDLAWYRDLIGERGDGVPPEPEARERLQRLIDSARPNGFELLVIERRATGEPAGYCGLIIGRSTAEEPEIAYELFRKDHGAGIATEAAAAVLAAASATGRSRLWATVGAWNAPSFRVLDKLNFVEDHRTTDDRGEIVWMRRDLR